MPDADLRVTVACREADEVVSATRSTIGARLADQLAPSHAPAVADPVSWISDVLGYRLWSAQVEIARSVAQNRYTAVRSAHGVGKSAVGAWLVAWFCSSFPRGDAFAVTAAPTGSQLTSVMWREIARAHRKGRLPGKITGGAVPTWTIDGELVAIGRKPQDLVDPEEAAAAFQGIHARNLLIVLDESGGIPSWLWDAASTLMTSAGARVLAIGNPVDPQSRFAAVCAPESGWNSIQVSAFDAPAFTGEAVAPEVAELLVGREWVDDVREQYGEDSAYYTARVLAEFPDESEDGLIPRSRIRAAQARDLLGEALGAVPVLGVDVGRGGDATVIYELRGGCARLRHSSRDSDLMRSTGTVAAMLRGPAPARAVIDQTGLGAGVLDRLREQELEAFGFQGAERARASDRFANRRAETYWMLRERFDSGAIDLDPADVVLAAQLAEVRWHVNSRGLVQIEDKAAQARRGGGSPDRADALSMAAGSPHLAMTFDHLLDPLPVTPSALADPDPDLQPPTLAGEDPYE